jgi:EAL domain-containing protein (putative c-di-GMP-specific phosphodiesterase class I)
MTIEIDDAILAEPAMPSRRTQAAARRRMQRKLDAAALDNGMEMQFHPRINLATGAIIGAEALIRWPDRRGEMPRPGRFLKLPAQIDQSLRIGAWALSAACSACAESLPADRPWCVSVNVSARQLAEGVLLRQLAAALEESGLPAERLELELTEPLLHDVSLDMLLTLSAVRDLGVGLSIDEFGTGFTSLALLRRLPVTAIKLDRGLLRAVPQEREDTAILRALIEAGHALNLEIVAEGVEREAQRGFLSSVGCEAGQGSLFGPPITLPQLQTALLLRMTKR